MSTTGHGMRNTQHATCDTIATYGQWLAAQGFDEETINNKVRLLSRLPQPLTEVTQDDVLELLAHARKNSTRRVYLNNLRLAFRDMRLMGLLEDDPTVGLRTPPPQPGRPQPLPPHEVALLMTMRERERGWTILGLRAGLRAIEVVRLERKHLQQGIHGWQLRVPRGKNDKDATIPAHPQVVELMTSLPNTDGPIWDFHSRYISRKWKEHAEKVGVHGRRFHQLRHTFATNAYKASGQDLLLTRDLLRHSSVQSTQIYAGIEDDRPFAVVAGL